jgi:hypothetical protein
MIPIVKHRLEWDSSCLRPIRYKEIPAGPAYPLEDYKTSTRAELCHNIVVYSTIDELSPLLATVREFENSLCEFYEDNAARNSVKPGYVLRARDLSGKAHSKLLTGPSRILTRQRNRPPFKDITCISTPAVIALHGSSMDIFRSDFLEHILADHDFFHLTMVLWGVPETLQHLMRAFFKAVLVTENNATPPKVSDPA